ncbi:VOC family protein [Planomonospora venezuelensis]|uniref:Catechol 2,3-dioxygenase-like lactoylglutathione lyase family enzyme n=1 Tax=Planomonospora venezuelensis TaxID=1999 RepID=A0A841D003_PLAVE|nr:VOC family protein [Planomonospora venezuelensis]MBB5963992.1 catechol 2,3-dioxygenase-like lactoylglutathione lyase family enzyme [Planomonospora venezuelensis]GIN05073.1 lactoylglutathione lyase [Planomonospora venezuelensis]
MTFKTGHIGLNVSDLDASKDFYRKVFGFEVMGESGEDGRRYAFLGLGGTLVLTLWQQSEGRFATGLPGLHHLSFEVPDIETVRRAEQVVRELGATLHHDGAVAHGEGASSGGVFFEDPDGIRLEIYAPTGAGELPAPSATAPTCGFF